VFAGPVYVPEEMPEQTVDVPHVEIIEQPKVSKLSQKQIDKILISDIATVKKALKAIETGTAEATPEQVAQIEIYHELLINS
jgi:hypothetical protein